MLEMIENTTEKVNERQNWFKSLKEINTARQKRKEIQEKRKKELLEENERFRSFIDQNR